MRRKYDKTQFIKTLEEAPFISYAAKKSGIARATIYRWMESDKNFKEAVDGAVLLGRKISVDVAEMGLMSLIKDKNLGAIKFFLQHNSETYKPEKNCENGIKKSSLTKEELYAIRETEKQREQFSKFTGKEKYEHLKWLIEEMAELVKQYEETGLDKDSRNPNRDLPL